MLLCLRVVGPGSGARLAGPGGRGDTGQMPDSPFLVRVSRTIPVPAQAIFDVLADPGQHPVIDGGGTVLAARAGGPERLSLGAKFAMDMHLAANYKILNTVVEFEEPRLIAWRHFNGHIWRYRLTEVEGGTRVEEEWDARKAKSRLGLVLLGFPHRNRRAMTGTLDRLANLVTAPQ